MHPIQEKLLKLIGSKNIGKMTLREIASAVGEDYPQKIKHHLTQLERKGFIRIDKKNGIIERRSVGAVENAPLVAVPIVGAANCGPATIFAEENIEGYLRVSPKLLAKTKNVFALRASGISMNRANVGGKTIEDGDYAVIDSEAVSPEKGDIILSVIDGMATIKRYVPDPENEQILLVADSSREFPPIYLHAGDDFIVNGKVIQVIKKPSV